MPSRHEAKEIARGQWLEPEEFIRTIREHLPISGWITVGQDTRRPGRIDSIEGNWAMISWDSNSHEPERVPIRSVRFVSATGDLVVGQRGSA